MLDATVNLSRRALGAAERVIDGAARRAGRPAGGLARALTRLPLVGAVGGSVVGRAPLLDGGEFGAARSAARTPGVTRIVVDERGSSPANVGALVKRKFFGNYPAFTFNVSFACGAADSYADPRSIWFNVFVGYYEIVAPKSLWGRPFGYELDAARARVRFEDITRLGKADWNYFSNYVYGVPARAVEPYDGVDMGAVECRRLGRERVGAEGRSWDVVELGGVEVVSAYVSGRDGRRLESPGPLYSPLWRLTFGRSRPRTEYPESFIPTRMRARLRMSYCEGRDPRLGEVYRTAIFGGTINEGYPDAARNELFLDRQTAALRHVIERHYAHLGFAAAERAEDAGRRVPRAGEKRTVFRPTPGARRAAPFSS